MATKPGKNKPGKNKPGKTKPGKNKPGKYNQADTYVKSPRKKGREKHPSDTVMSDFGWRQQDFVNRMLVEPNATIAYRDAYGVSYERARSLGPRMMRDPRFLAVLDKERDRRNKAADIDALFVLRRLLEEVNADVKDLFTEGNQLKKVHDWPLVWRRGLVSGVTIREVEDKDGNAVATITKVKISDRVQRIKLLGQHTKVGAFAPDKNEVNNTQINITITAEDASVL